MTARLRTAALAMAAAAGLLVAPIALASSAAAAPVPSQAQILFFSNPDVTDQVEEDPTQIAALEEAGNTVTVFDGGDGTAAAWSAALAGKDALVVPETDDDGGNQLYPGPYLDGGAADVVYDFLYGGGRVVLPTAYEPELLSFLTMVDYTAVWNVNDSTGPWLLEGADPALPAQLENANGTYPVLTFDTWSPEQLAAVTPLYVSEDGTELAAASWTVGAGTVSVLAYDWFPDEGEAAVRAPWNVLLQYLVNVPVPQLAATGAPIAPTTLALAAALLVLGAAAAGVTAVRRRATL
jgi:hypothetical protein